MNQARKIIYLVAVISAATVMLLLLAVLLVPTGDIIAAAERGMARQGYILRVEKAAKVFPSGLRLGGVLVSDRRGPLLRLDRAVIRLKLLPLCLGRVVVSADGRIGAGRIRGEYWLSDGDLKLTVTDVLLEDLPWFRTATGARISGQLAVDGTFAGRGDKNRGRIRLEARRAGLADVAIGGIDLPDASYDTVRGMLSVSSGRCQLEGLTFQGEGVYLRLKGEFPITSPMAAAPLNLTLELLPKPDFIERQKLVFLALDRYRTTPGAYQLPISGTLGKPAIR